MPDSVPSQPRNTDVLADQSLLDVVVDAQVRCVRGDDDGAVFAGLLGVVLELTGASLAAVVEVIAEAAGRGQPGAEVVASTRVTTGHDWDLPAPDDPVLARLASRAATKDAGLVTDWPGSPPGWRFVGLPLNVSVGHAGVLALVGRMDDPAGMDARPGVRAIRTSCAVLLAAHADRRMRAIANRRLRESEAKGQATLDNVSDAIFMIDESGLIETANAAALKVFGYEIGDLVGQNVSMLMPEPHRARHDGYVADHIRTGRARVIGIGRRVEGVRKDGVRIPLDLSVNAVNLGERRLFVGVLHDASERQILDQHVALLQSELASRVQELDRVARENALLGEFSSFLQAAASEDEARRVLRTYGDRLFATEAGAFHSLVDDRTLVEAVAWGPSFGGETVLQRRDCWALRRSDVHVVEPGRAELACPHLRLGPSDASLCVPVLSPEGVVGLMTLQWTVGEDHKEHPDAGIERNRMLVDALADRLGSALSSIGLRVRLEQESIRDPLTRVYNRRYLEPAFGRAIQQALQDDTPVSVIMADIDHFKQVNDTHGHEIGDEVLRSVADALGVDLRRSDVVCRIGGEEFLILLPGAPIKVATRRAEKIRMDRAIARIPTAHGPIGPVTVSFGVATYPTHGTRPDEVIAAADAAMYLAKAEGRNRVVAASDLRPRPLSLRKGAARSRAATTDQRSPDPASDRGAPEGPTVATDATDAA